VASTPVAPQTKAVAWWKRWLVFGAGAGAGFAFALAAIVGIVLWYESRPKPPKPWNTAAISASFSHISTQSEITGQHTSADNPYADLGAVAVPPNVTLPKGFKLDDSLVFFYTLENGTDFDYRLPNAAGIAITARLKRERSLSRFLNAVTVDYPVFIPAHQRVLLAVHLPDYVYPERLPPPGAERRAKLAAYVAKEMPNLDGFVLFDEANRYQINFPKGW
jgi:hypothetical protein